VPQLLAEGDSADFEFDDDNNGIREIAASC
jgi:hypothetical protein